MNTWKRKNKTKYKDGGFVGRGKLGTHSAGLFVFRNMSKPPLADTYIEVCSLAKHEGSYYIGERDWDRVKVDSVNEDDDHLVFMHFI